MALPRTHQRKLKTGVKPTFPSSGARNCGLPHHLISIQWTSVCSPCWRQRPVLHFMLMLRLKLSLVKAWAKIPQEKLQAAVKSFRGRIERVIQEEGGHIEN